MPPAKSSAATKPKSELTPKSGSAPKRSPSIKQPDVYEALREQGASPEKAARISNAKAKYGSKGPNAPSVKGGKAPPYDEWTRAELYGKAREIGLDRLSRASKAELVHALRTH